MYALPLLNKNLVTQLQLPFFTETKKGIVSKLECIYCEINHINLFREILRERMIFIENNNLHDFFGVHIGFYSRITQGGVV